VYLFFSAFSSHLPVVHEGTWQEDGKPPVLMRLMQACGALFVRTKPAAQFVAQVLTTAREEIINEYVCHRFIYSPCGMLINPQSSCRHVV
jgi:hypothetical protein